MRVVEMRGPADLLFVRLLRTATFAIAADVGLSVDQSAELVLASDEACNVLIDSAATELNVTFVEQGRLALIIRPTRPVDVNMDAVSELILKTMTEGLSIDPGGAISLRKELS